MKDNRYSMAEYKWKMTGPNGETMFSNDGNFVIGKNTSGTDLKYTVEYTRDDSCVVTQEFTVKGGSECINQEYGCNNINLNYNMCMKSAGVIKIDGVTISVVTTIVDESGINTAVGIDDTNLSVHIYATTNQVIAGGNSNDYKSAGAELDLLSHCTKTSGRFGMTTWSTSQGFFYEISVGYKRLYATLEKPNGEVLCVAEVSIDCEATGGGGEDTGDTPTYTGCVGFRLEYGRNDITGGGTLTIHISNQDLLPHIGYIGNLVYILKHKASGSELAATTYSGPIIDGESVNISESPDNYELGWVGMGNDGGCIECNTGLLQYSDVSPFCTAKYVINYLNNENVLVTAQNFSKHRCTD